jgi:hypothetical protein
VRPLTSDLQQVIQSLPASAQAAAGAQAGGTGGNGASGDRAASEDDEVIDAEFTRE